MQYMYIHNTQFMHKVSACASVVCHAVKLTHYYEVPFVLKLCKVRHIYMSMGIYKCPLDIYKRLWVYI